MTRQKRKLTALWALSFTAIFMIGFMIGGMENESREIIPDAEYKSLLGIIEDIPNVDYWTIERDKYIRNNYNDMSWSLRIRYNDNTSISFSDRNSIQKIFNDLENLNEAELYTSPSVDKK